jgi:hypothetical protein|eukprot:COSAG01_NODE_4545_length_4932_cov_102.732671_2_plen_121_part_00
MAAAATQVRYHHRAAVRAPDWYGGRGQQISARFSGRMVSVVWARTSEISAVVVATPLRDLGLLFFSCLLPAAFSVPCWLSGADREWLQHVCAGLWCTAACGRECQRVSSDIVRQGGMVVV